MIDEFKKSVSATLYERLASPLIGSYVVSWCIWNYQVFLIILSSLDYDKKIEKLDAHFYTGWGEWLSAFSIPILVTALYIFIYPRIAKYVFKLWQIYIADKEKIRQEIKKDVPISKEQADKLQQDIAKQSVEFENRLNDKNERIKFLEGRDKDNLIRIDEREKEIAVLKEQLQKITNELSAFHDREKMIADYDIKADSTGLLQANKGIYQHRTLCPSCLNASPPKLIPLPDRIPNDQQFIKCPSCKGEYLNDDYRPEEETRISAAVDNEFLCWCRKIDKNIIRYCPTCAIWEKELKIAELAKVSENEYKCVLCSKSYPKANNSTI